MFGLFKSSIEKKTLAIERSIKDIVSGVANEKCWVTHYGANDIHPKHLVYWIVVETDKEKNKLNQDEPLLAKLRETLTLHNYPMEGREAVYIGFESDETVQREAGGNYYHYWK